MENMGLEEEWLSQILGQSTKSYTKGMHYFLEFLGLRSIDILAVDPTTGQIKQAIESTNYSKKCYIAKERAERYAKSLNQFPYAKKKLVVSFKENVGDEARKILEDSGVKIEVVGHQELSLDDEHFKAFTRKVITLDSHDDQQK